MRDYNLSNPFQPNSFLFVIEGLEDFAFQVQSAELPPMSTGAVASDWQGNQGFVSGDKMTYSSASLTFVVDEQMKGYLSIMKWMEDGVKVTEEANASKDVTVIIMTPQNTPLAECRLINAIPISLSGISLTTENTDPILATLDVEIDQVVYTPQT